MSPLTPDIISIFLISTNLTSETWHHAEFLIYSSLIIWKVKHLFSICGSLVFFFFFFFLGVDLALPSVICPFLIGLCERFEHYDCNSLSVLCVANIFSCSLAGILTLWCFSLISSALCFGFALFLSVRPVRQFLDGFWVLCFAWQTRHDPKVMQTPPSFSSTF